MSKSVSKINITLSARIGNFRKKFGQAGKSMKKFKQAGRGMFRGMQAGFTRMIASVFAIRAAFIALSNVMKGLFERENLFSKLQIFERTVAQTSKTFKELEDFSIKTPFEPTELIKGFTLLRALGGEALGTVDMVKKLGDAAVTTGVGFDIIAANVGRMFNALKKGNIGQTANELRSYGLLSAEVQDKIEAMGKAGGTQAELFDVFLKGLKKFDGAMAIMSQTTTGLISTFKGLAKIRLAEGLDPALTVFKNLLKFIVKTEISFKGMATSISNAIERFKDLFIVGEELTKGGKATLTLIHGIGTSLLAVAQTAVAVAGVLINMFGMINEADEATNKKGDFFGSLNAGLKAIPGVMKVILELSKFFGNVMADMMEEWTKYGNFIMDIVKTLFKWLKNHVILSFTAILQKAKAIGFKVLSALTGADFDKATNEMEAAYTESLNKIGKSAEGTFFSVFGQVTRFSGTVSKEVKESMKDIEKAIHKVLDLGDPLAFGAEEKNLDKWLQNMKELIKTLTDAKGKMKDLAKVEKADAKGANSSVKKFADLAKQGTDAAFKSIISHMFSESGTQSIEEEQLAVGKEQLAVQKEFVNHIKELDADGNIIRIF